MAFRYTLTTTKPKWPSIHTRVHYLLHGYPSNVSWIQTLTCQNLTLMVAYYSLLGWCSSLTLVEVACRIHPPHTLYCSPRRHFPVPSRRYIMCCWYQRHIFRLSSIISFWVVDIRAVISMPITIIIITYDSELVVLLVVQSYVSGRIFDVFKLIVVEDAIGGVANGAGVAVA